MAEYCSMICAVTPPHGVISRSPYIVQFSP
jgi:hypothetical protein